jgi:hypothetical protein
VDKLDDADSSAGNIGDSIEEANEYIAEVIEAIEEAMNA